MSISIRGYKRGFTIVELSVVIAIIGILVAISIVGYGAWRERTAKTEVQSDLKQAASAMENARNFDNGYPATLPNSFTASQNVTVTLAGDANSFCIDGVSKVVPTIAYFINSTDHKDPVQGTCDGGPGAITPSGPGWTAISTGTATYTCAISTLGSKAYCWGNNTSGQLGNNSTTTSSTPVAVDTSGVLASKTIKSIAAGTGHTCVIASDDKAYCWGQNTYGQLGDNSTTSSSVPVAVDTSGLLAGKTLKSITAGTYSTCAIASDSNAYCWGYNYHGQLGNNSTTNSSVPVAVSTSGVLSGKTVKSISPIGNSYYVCAVASDNNAYCWGQNNYGQLGNNSTTKSSTPVPVSTSGTLAGKTVKSITVGSSHTCAVASDNNAYCWGYNYNGQLGNNSTTNSSVPVAVSTSGVLSGKTVNSITAGNNYVCAVASDNNAYCWGGNANGQFGNNSVTSSSVPVAVNTSGVLAGKILKSISAPVNASHTCAISSDYHAYCWGGRTNGRLGDGSTTGSTVPLKVNNP